MSPVEDSTFTHSTVVEGAGHMNEDRNSPLALQVSLLPLQANKIKITKKIDGSCALIEEQFSKEHDSMF